MRLLECESRLSHHSYCIKYIDLTRCWRNFLDCINQKMNHVWGRITSNMTHKDPAACCFTWWLWRCFANCASPGESYLCVCDRLSSRRCSNGSLHAAPGAGGSRLPPVLLSPLWLTTGETSGLKLPERKQTLKLWEHVVLLLREVRLLGQEATEVSWSLNTSAETLQHDVTPHGSAAGGRAFIILFQLISSCRGLSPFY